MSDKHTVESVKKDTGYLVRDAALVVQLGLVYDNYKHGMLDKLWKASEKAALERMPTFDPTQLFHEHSMIESGQSVWYSFRYYTPASNILERPGH